MYKHFIPTVHAAKRNSNPPRTAVSSLSFFRQQVELFAFSYPLICSLHSNSLTLSNLPKQTENMLSLRKERCNFKIIGPWRKTKEKKQSI